MLRGVHEGMRRWKRQTKRTSKCPELLARQRKQARGTGFCQGKSCLHVVLCKEQLLRLPTTQVRRSKYHGHLLTPVTL